MPSVDLVPQYQRDNGWHEILPELTEPTQVVGDIVADYVVVGGGYSGLAATRRLAELDPGASVALVEGTRIGNNAAGRSSGFAIDHAHNLRAKGFASDTTHAKQQIALNRSGLAYLDEIITREGIDCDWRQDGKYHAAASERGERMLGHFAESLDAIDEDYTLHDADELGDIFGTRYYNKALHAPHSYLVQPAALVRGLADTMPPNVTVYEDSMVRSVDYGPPHVLRTDRGSVTTPILVLATNGFVEGFGFFKRHLIPLITWGSMTRQLTPSEVERLGGVESYGIIGGHPAGSSIRRTADHRILVRNIFSYSRKSNIMGFMRERSAKQHRRSFEARWPQLADVPFENSWGGALSLARNGEPVFGELQKNVYASVVHQGVGIARGSIAGRLLAEMILGQDSEELRLMQAKGRPNKNLPFQGLGVIINAEARRIIAGREE